jgi:NAD(P)-dependent dehydrogenase (short-subunit alcohol dehydrogenase family)
MADKRLQQISRHLNFPKGLLAGQVAIITGSGQGIGAETAIAFAKEGAKVIVSDIDAGWFHCSQVTNLTNIFDALADYSFSESQSGCAKH